MYTTRQLDHSIVAFPPAPLARRHRVQRPKIAGGYVPAALLFLCLAVRTPGVTTNYHAAVAADAPLLAYRFNESSGNAINYGSLGHGFDATYFGTPSRGAATAAGDSGVAFDSPDDYLESAGSAPAALLGNPTFTVEAVFFVPASGGAALWAPFLHWGPSSGPPSANTMLSVYFSFSNNDANRLYAGFYNGGLRTADPVPLGQWRHLVWVRQGGGAANAGTTLYLDGLSARLENDPALPANSATPAVTTTPFRVNRARDFTRYFIGTLDEVALYSHALTPTQVQRHYDAFAQPRLAIQRPPSGPTTLSWQPPSAGFVLQEKPALPGGNWINSPSGSTNPITLPAPTPSRFYRLTKP